MIPTLPYIQQHFDDFNIRFFNGSLPPIPIKLSNARTFLGKVTYVKRRNFSLTSWLFSSGASSVGEWTYSNFKLRINTRYDLPEELIQDTILHEMIHYYIAVNQLRDTSSHGRLFRREMARINADGNRHITISYRLSKEQLLELYPEKKEQIEAYFLRKSKKSSNFALDY